MSYFKKSLIITLCFTALMGCKGQNNKSVITLNSSDILNDETLTPEQKAEKIALIGEQLMIPSGFMYANSIFDIALSQDVNNKRAICSISYF